MTASLLLNPGASRVPCELQQGTGMIFSDECEALNFSFARVQEKWASLTVCPMLLQILRFGGSSQILRSRFHAPSSVIILLQKATSEFVSPVVAFFFSPLSTLAKLSQPISGITTHLIGCPVRTTCFSLATSGSAGLLKKTYAGLALTIYTFASDSGSRLHQISQPQTRSSEISAA
jgi:hypothetical protein